MPLSVHVSCDVCGVVKQQTNHWYLVWSRIVGRRLAAGGTSTTDKTAKIVTYEADPMIMLMPFRMDTATSNPEYQIVCGEACMSKLISQSLALLHQKTLTTKSEAEKNS